ncbi:excisionase family DNA-binding protein [Ochrobactrum sp. Marseille-Q0166]|nr:excisionase family DNA-binding protein [Ochrobactrum sp. Marseille-Q0166]
MTNLTTDEHIAFTPDTLAERWQCSAQHIRDLVNKKKIPSFRVGRLYRIPYSAVLDYECPTKSDRNYSEENGTQSGMTASKQSVGASAPQIVMGPHAV